MPSLFFELIQVALGNRASLSHTPTTEEWQRLFMLSKKQALLGINYVAVEHLPKEQRPPRQLLLQWCLAAERIKERNAELNRKVVEISHKFHNDGFPNLILKGQGIAQYYKICNLEQYRTPGDVDLWFKGSREDIIDYVRKYNPTCHVVYHHVDFPDIDGVQIEIHFMPSWMNCYFTNKRLQHFFNDSKEFDLASYQPRTIPAPSLEFNRLYILIHIYRHLFHEGIGLRQVMDYYFVLMQGFNEEQRTETIRMIRLLHMTRFTAAIMWILKDVFGMEERHLLMSPSEKDGHLLLNEIMMAGNLGLHDTRLKRSLNESNLKYGLRKIKRNLKFTLSYPSEVLWSPVFKIWHYFWRKKTNSGK